MKNILQKLTVLLFLFAASFACGQSLNLVDEAAKSGMTVYWDSLSGAGILEKNGHQISFKTGDNFIL